MPITVCIGSALSGARSFHFLSCDQFVLVLRRTVGDLSNLLLELCNPALLIKSVPKLQHNALQT